MTFKVRYPTGTMIGGMVIEDQMSTLSGDHPAKQWPISHQTIPSRQHFETMPS